MASNKEREVLVVLQINRWATADKPLINRLSTIFLFVSQSYCILFQSRRYTGQQQTKKGCCRSTKMPWFNRGLCCPLELNNILFSVLVFEICPEVLLSLFLNSMGTVEFWANCPVGVQSCLFLPCSARPWLSLQCLPHC